MEGKYLENVYYVLLKNLRNVINYFIKNLENVNFSKKNEHETQNL